MDFEPAVIQGAARVRHAKTSMTLNVANTTGSIATFTITGTVLVQGFWGIVTTVLSSNITAAHIRTNDSSATVDVSLNTGVTLSSLAVGSLISRNALVSGALASLSASQTRFADPGAAAQPYLIPFVLMQKPATTTTLDFRYTTTNNPSSGVILWNALWIPLSADGNLA